MNNDPQLEFHTVVETYYSSLFRFAISLAGSEADASDLTQQTFLIWAQKGDQLRDGSKVKTWLFTTLYREFLRTRRREKTHPHQSLDESPLEFPDESVPSPEQMDAPKVLEALQSLDEVYRQPVALFYLEDMSYKQIADVLEVPIGTVMSRLARGKAMLRKSLSLLMAGGAR